MDFSSQNILKGAPAESGGQRNQKKLIIILVLAVLATIFVLYFAFSSEESAPAATSVTGDSAADIDSGAAVAPEELPAAAQERSDAAATGSATAVENISLDFSVLDDAKFQSLKIFGAGLDTSGPKGRSNPFIPY